MANRGQVCRSGDNGADSNALLPPKKQLEQFEPICALKTQFFSTYHPDIIEDAILTHLRNVVKIEPKINENKYKIKFQLTSKD